MALRAICRAAPRARTPQLYIAAIEVLLYKYSYSTSKARRYAMHHNYNLVRPSTAPMTLLHGTRKMPSSTSTATSSASASSSSTLIDVTIEESQQADDETFCGSYNSKEWQDVACRVKFWLGPRRHQLTATTPAPWEACIILKTKDLSRLMLQGFHWTAAENLEPYVGCLHH